MRRKAQKSYRVGDAVEIYRAIREEFDYTPDPLCNDTPKARRTKWVCSNRLEKPERVLIYLYAELGSVRDLADLLGVARSTLGDELKRIKDKIQREVAMLEEKEKKNYGTDA